MTNSKVLTLGSVLEEMQRDIQNLAYALGAARDKSSAAAILEMFQYSHALSALAVLDEEGSCLFGDQESIAMKGIPADFAVRVQAEGFAMSDTLIGIDGGREILFGSVIPGGGAVYCALPAALLQETCGEDTYLGVGYSYVLKRDGEIIIPPVRYSYEQVYENISILLSDSGNPADKIEQFMEALSSGKTGSVVFMIRGQEQILCFEPVKTEKEWQFVTTVPLEVAEREGARTIQTAIYMAGLIIAAIVTALMAGVWSYLSALRRQRENDRFLRDIYQAISENTDTVIFILDSRSKNPEYVFENSERLLGISYEEFVDGRNHKTEEGAFFKKLQSLLQETWPEEGCQREVNWYNDRLHCDMWLKILICPFHMGAELKCIYAVTDITKERQDRERISAAVVAAEQANAAKSSFFSNMSHDMRTPMNGIVGMTAIAKNNLDNRDRVLDCLNKIEFSSNHLLGLINDVLDMSKIESGKLALTSDPFQLPELFWELEAILKSQCDDRKQTLTFDIQIRHKRVLGDALRIKQILMNLLSNAVKFTPQGGSITLTVREQEQRRAECALYQFSVEDNGIGMSPEFLKTVFTPFERAADSVVRQTEGTGLGMAITKNLVSAMGGQISVKSKEGCGTTFLVDLELELQEKSLMEQPDQEPEPATGISFAERRFLLAEDNAINQEIAVELLNGYGAEVEVADNGKQALERFIKSTPGYYDAILMDIQMPVMNGYEAAAAIRSCSHPEAGRIPIIAMTANVFAEDVIAARNAGMDGHIPKPVDIRYLYQILQDVFKKINP
ncbi:ATP-binding protein [Clostridium sp. AN503]|uniref:ATP-binding protein n=1 Tax=Clostridium sp. AN503 TaxID=3160598 RepID=UPI00345781EA